MQSRDDRICAERNIRTFEEELERSGRLVYTNVGVSMRPLLREGRDIMVIDRLDREPLKYDAVLFIRPGIVGRGRYILHRVLRVNGDGTYWIVGDNCTAGETVKRENIIGVMTAVRRGKKTVRTDAPGYRLYVALWCAPYPLRFAVLKCSRVFRRYAGAALRRIKGLFTRSRTHHPPKGGRIE